MERGRNRQYWLWCGRQGTSFDLNLQQARSLLIEKDFVLSPEPIVQHNLNIHDMKQYTCGVFQLCTPDFLPIDEPRAYATFLGQLNICQHWIATGETNKDGIFHCHCLMQTTSRPDSVRRSMGGAWEKLKTAESITGDWGQECELSLIKMQKCHRPSALLGYMTKSPLWIISSNEQLLQMAYDQDQWGMNARFKQPAEPETSPDMNDMSKAFIEIIMEGNCKTIEEMIEHNPQIMSKYLHRPGLVQIVNNCLTFVRATAGQIDLSYYKTNKPDPTAIHKVLLYQGIVPTEFDEIFYKWFTKQEKKKNTIILQGPSNTGKSQFVQGLKQCCPYGEIVNGQSGFNYEALLGNPLALWEEPLISPEGAEKFKQIAEGMPTMIPVKYKKPQHLPRTPVIITTNHNIWRFCTHEEEMFRNRCSIFYFMHSAITSEYTCRAREPSCTCSICYYSRRGKSPDGSPSRSGSEQYSEQLDRGANKPATEHMDDPGEGPSSGCITTSSTEVRKHTTIKSRGSIMSRTDRHMDRGHSRSSNPRDRISPGPTKHVEPERYRTDHDTDSRGDGTDNNSRRGRAEKDMAQSLLLPSMGLLCDTTTQEKEIQIPDKQRQVDRIMGTSVTLTIPSSQQWKEYLSYLFHVYHNA
uniref:NS1 n=1 Tax=Tasmanian devil-associated chapparvovirus 4 TaxID=2529485 RepID=A0A481W761_9VIRU|nr:NS1 [Tasmanian devil-associated chapparvovirus 4]